MMQCNCWFVWLPVEGVVVGVVVVVVVVGVVWGIVGVVVVVVVVVGAFLKWTTYSFYIIENDVIIWKINSLMYNRIANIILNSFTWTMQSMSLFGKHSSYPLRRCIFIAIFIQSTPHSSRAKLSWIPEDVVALFIFIAHCFAPFLIYSIPFVDLNIVTFFLLRLGAWNVAYK